jgi:predicted MPP superfamily phosphohydrolase
VRGFDAIIGDGTNNNKRHLLIVAAGVERLQADKIGAVRSVLISAGFRSLPDLVILLLVLLTQGGGIYFLLLLPAVRDRKWARRAILAGGAASGVILIFGVLLMFARVARLFPSSTASWFRGWALIWGMLSVLWVGAWLVWRGLMAILRPAHSSARRGFLGATGAALVAAPLVTVGYGVFVERRNIRMREQKIVIPGLAEDLDGLRIVQLTDIHLSPFLSVRELAHAVGMANETNAHLALVTGDMISGQRDPLDACLENLAQLRSEAGIFGCLGNHEIYAHAENYATKRGAELGIRYLRSEAVRLKFGGAAMNLAGVDYQRFNEPYLMGAEDMVQPGMLNVLMSHNPDVFPVAADLGYALTIAGHTHGGQVRVEILREDLNIARFFTPYVDGLYQEGGRTIFVSRGIGTIGLPARLGAPPEVALLRLCRS